MTSPTAPRPDFDPADQSTDAGDANRSVAGPPNGAITLAELIADSGPLPADAALECVQRLAERLTDTPHVSHDDLGPGDVLIDDDGGVWLRGGIAGIEASAANDRLNGMDRLGRLLVFLTTGDPMHLTRQTAVDVATLPAPLSTVASRLVSQNGSCYPSYAELARDTARLRGSASAAGVYTATTPPDAVDRIGTVDLAPVESASASRAEDVLSGAAPQAGDTSGAKLAAALAFAAAVGAALAYVAWQWL